MLNHLAALFSTRIMKPIGHSQIGTQQWQLHLTMAPRISLHGTPAMAIYSLKGISQHPKTLTAANIPQNDGSLGKGNGTLQEWCHFWYPHVGFLEWKN